MAFDFPSSPTVGQSVTTSSGSTFIWDGTKWTSSSAGPGGSRVVTSDTAPTTPVDGDLWWDSVGGALYVWYDDGNTQQWVSAANMPGPTGPAAGRNLIHNPMFNIAQRGAGPWAVTGYTLDRWQITSASDTISITQQSVSDADRAVIGDEAATLALANTFTGNAAAGALNLLAQYIEGARRLGGKTVTVSFWAKAASGTPKLGINALQGFGSGGSPSAGVYALSTGMSVTLTTAYARYSVTFAIPSVSGKVFGTSGGDYTGIFIWYSSGATNNAVAGNIGVQSGTIQLWGVQLEIGSAATPLEKPDPQQDLAKCQRFYYSGAFTFLGYHGTAGGYCSQTFVLPVTMRAAPTTAYNITTNVNVTAGNSNVIGWAVNPNHYGTIAVTAQVTAAGGFQYTGTYTASADL